jgi:ribosome-binding factor A
VRVTPDLREATVYVSVLGGARRQRDSLAGLASAHGILQARINRELNLRRTPQLTFAYDDAVERGVRMSKLIDDLAADLPEDDGPVDDDTD